ncbi:MAG: DMT family transporter [Candidatus Promineifilaceae bacterium]
MNPKSLPYVSLLALFYGTTLIVSRFSLGQLAPLTYVSLRLLLASLCYAAIQALSRRRSWPRDRAVWRHAPVIGLIGTAIPMSFIVMSLQYQSSGITSLLLTAGPAITVILAHFALPDERLNRGKVVGVALAMSGAASLVLLGENGLPDVAEANPLGYVLVIVAIFSASVSTIYARSKMRTLDPFDVSSVRIWTAVALVLPAAYFLTSLDASRVEPSGVMALLYAGIVGTFGGMLLEFNIIQRFGATATAVTANLIPIVALIGGWLFLGEQITPGMLAAMALIIGGVSIITRSESVPLVEPIES